MPEKPPTESALLSALMRYCAFQERSPREVAQKLRSLGAEDNTAAQLIEQLETQGFLNEARYARAFAGGHFRSKQWGRVKIRAALRVQGISEDLIAAALREEIPEEDYRRSATALAAKQAGPFADAATRSKILRQLMQKGYEWEVAAAALNVEEE